MRSLWVLSVIFPTLLVVVQSAFIDFSYGGRTNKLYVPSNYNEGTAYPLFVMLHGCTQNPTDFAAGTDMNALAESYGFLVLYPLQPSSANANKCWNWFLPSHQARGSGEPAIIAGTVDAVSKSYNIDPEMISVSGLSAGAAQAVIMGATYPDIFCCVGVGAGLEFKAATSQTSAFTAMSSGGPNPGTQAGLAWNSMKANWREPLDVVVIHGTSDYTVAIINGNQTTQQWVMTNDLGLGGDRISTTPTSVTPGQVPGGRTYTTYKYADKETGIDVVTYVYVTGMGHAWSGGSSAGSYTDPKGPSASQILVDTFLDWEGATTESSTSTGDTTTSDSTTGPSTSTTSFTTSTTGGSTTSSTSSTSTTGGGKTIITLPSIIGQDGFVGQYTVDGYSTSVCKVGDKGMYSSDTFRNIIVFPTQNLPSGNIESIVLKINQISTVGTVNTINVDMNDGPFGTTVLKPADYYTVATIPRIASFNPQAVTEISLPSSAFSALTTAPTTFRLSATSIPAFAQNLITLGCGESTLTITYS